MSIAEFFFGPKCQVCDKTRSKKLELFKGKQACIHCKTDILFKEKREAILRDDPYVCCPMCQTNGRSYRMEKEFLTEKSLLVKDTCPTCKSVFLSAKELETLKEMAYKKGKRSGSNYNGFVTGYVVGSIIN